MPRRKIFLIGFGDIEGNQPLQTLNPTDSINEINYVANRFQDKHFFPLLRPRQWWKLQCAAGDRCFQFEEWLSYVRICQRRPMAARGI